MNIEDIQLICQQMTNVIEDIKWEHDLVFSIGGKMFCVVGLDQSPTTASFKVKDEEFEDMCNRPGFNKMKKTEWRHYLRQSYDLVKNKLSLKLRKQLGLE